MVLLNEILPNPVGSDEMGEFIELWNSGGSDADLAGWYLTNQSGKTFVLQGTIPAGGYHILPYQTTRLTIKNSGETISLYDAVGALQSRASFSGSAKEGASFIRSGARFVFTKTPTRGNENELTALFAVNTDFFFQKPGDTIPGFWGGMELIFIAVMVGVLTAWTALYILRTIYAAMSYDEPLK